jgi:flagellum-specific peptidoglycan hydrolase FlgJ
MISDILGLSINQKVLNKKSPSSVVSTLEKTATNYIAIGRMAGDLKLIRLNFSRWLAMEGVKVRGTPDMHMLKEDELTKKFGVLREKYAQSKVTKAAQDGTSGNKGGMKTLLLRYVTRKYTRPFERKVAASVLKRYKKLTTIRNIVRLKRKLLGIVKNLLSKLNVKKMFMTWIKNNVKVFIKPILQVITNALKRFITTGLTKLASRFVPAFLASVGFSGPFAIAIAAVITIGLMVWDPLMEAIEEYKKGGNFFETFIVGLMDEFTLGLFGKENIKEFNTEFVKWYDSLFAKMFDAIDKSMQFIEKKMTAFATFIIEKGKSMFVTKQNQGDFLSAFDELNRKRLEEEQQTREKYAKYFEQMQDAIDNKKVNIRQLEMQIAQLEYDLKVLVDGPEKARLEATKIEKVKQEQELAKLEEERIKSREGGAPAEEKKAKKTEPPAAAPAPAPKPAPAVAPAPAPASKPAAAPDVTPVVAPQTGQYDESPPKGKFTSSNEFVVQMYDAAKKAATKMNVPTLGLLAQWALESGWGSKPSGDYNYFGLKSFGKPPQKLVVTKEQSLSPGAIENYKKKGWFIKQAGITSTVKDLFKSYTSIDEAINAQADFLLKNPRYAKAGVFGTKTPLEYGEALKKAGYATAANYAKEINSVSKSIFTRLSQNDKVQYAQNGEFLGSSGTKMAATETPTKTAASGSNIGKGSTEVAQAQREQLKPKNVDVIKTAKVNNNKQNQQENVAMNAPGPDSGSVLLNRATT